MHKKHFKSFFEFWRLHFYLNGLIRFGHNKIENKQTIVFWGKKTKLKIINERESI